MQKTLRGKVYDTAAMNVYKKVSHGWFGDESGYEETLYVAEDGTNFLYTNGGANSPSFGRSPWTMYLSTRPRL